MVNHLVRAEWEFNQVSRGLKVVLIGPSRLLRAFDTPGDVLAQFVRAVSAQGIGELITDSMRLSVSDENFIATWKGHPAANVDEERISIVMRRVIAELE